MGISKGAKNAGIFGAVGAACAAVVGWIIFQHEKPELKKGPEQVAAYAAKCGKEEGWPTVCGVLGAHPVNQELLNKYVGIVQKQGYKVKLTFEETCSDGPGMMVIRVDPALDDAGAQCFGQDPMSWCQMSGEPSRWYETTLLHGKGKDEAGRELILGAATRIHPHADISYLTALYHSLGWDDWHKLPQTGHVLNKRDPGSDNRGTDCE